MKRPQGKKTFTSPTTSQMVGAVIGKTVEPLTPREQEMVGSLLEGQNAVNGIPPTSQFDNKPISSLYDTMNEPLRTLAKSAAVRLAYGAPKELAVPSVLMEGGLFRSWSKALQLDINAIVASGSWYDPNNPSASPSGLWYDKSSPLLTIASDFGGYPSLADLQAYEKALAAIQAGTYSQTARIEGLPGPRIPIATVQSTSTIPDTSESLVQLADSITFDTVAASLLAPRQADQFMFTDAFTAFANGSTDPWNATNVNGNRRTTLLPQGSSFGIASTAFADNAAITESAAFMLEFYRQLICSPVVQLRAIPRSGFAYQDGFGYESNQISLPKHLSQEEIVNTSRPQATSPMGDGGVSIYMYFSLQDVRANVTQVYTPIDFMVNFTAKGNSPLSLVVPRGKSISNIYHPGFELAPGQKQPIIPDVSKPYSWNIAFHVITYGSASAYEWKLSMANPASIGLRILRGG